MDSDKGPATVEKRDSEEKQFFSDGIWKDLPNGLLGITELNSRLSKVLLHQIAHELPNVIHEISTKLEHCREQLNKLGQPRSTITEQTYYLMQVSQSFQTLVKAAVDGTYNDTFFEDPGTDRGYKQRIRAVVQNLNRDFAQDISERGHYRQITSDTEAIAKTTATGADTDNKPADSDTAISREAFVDHIQALMQRTRGRELPCTFSPMIVTNLFLEQCRPWGPILEDHVQKVWAAAKEFMELICTHIADSTAAKHLLSEIIVPALDELKEPLNKKAQELMLPHQEGHPITYNQQFCEAFQKSRNDRRRGKVVQILRENFAITDIECESTFRYVADRNVNFANLVESLAVNSEPDMDRFAASEALDCMEAYYEASIRSFAQAICLYESRRGNATKADRPHLQVALQRFLDNVAVDLVENKLIMALARILQPADIFGMPYDKVERIAGEPEENKHQREQLNKQVHVLDKGSEFCKRFVGLRIGGEV